MTLNGLMEIALARHTSSKGDVQSLPCIRLAGMEWQAFQVLLEEGVAASMLTAGLERSQCWCRH